MKNLKLGVKAKNNVNGFEGVITAKSIRLNGNISYLLSQQELKDGEHKKGQWYDEQVLKSDGKIIVEPTELAKTDVNLGDKVKHYSGFIGVAEERIDYLNGCVYFHVMPKVKKENELPKTEFIASQYLEVVKKKEVKSKPESTGGPSSLAPEM